MKPEQEHHAEHLEALLSSHTNQNASAQLHPAVLDNVDAEVSEMAMLARYLQTSPSLTADPIFVQRLERKVLAHSVRRTQTQAARRNGHWLFGWAPQMWVTFATIILLCVLMGTGTVLSAATDAANPDNPLYEVKVWEQHTQLSLAHSPQNKADISLQIVRDRLNAASSMTNLSDASAYQQTIQDAEQQIDAASQIINTLPAGSDRQRLSNELTTLKNDTRQTLYRLLPKLSFAAQLTTTTFLGHLGAPVPSIQSATVVITGHSPEQATITITGTNLTSHTRLVINNQQVAGNCTFQQNTCVFVISWQDQNPPTSIAVLNEDDTIAQTTVITSTYPNRGNGNDGNTKNGGNNGDGGHNRRWGQ